ncbi:dihydrolipoyllysine-residue (2-methylpropanoyl)transferase [Chytriomyces confervae]|uniref:Dihydrolipoamide acetyltransferase component of pyruvate dehydrogenase complex n=1 Tax=Chytriomyces confervae TaxID=246404 RepID=A0A507F717_9FUNG|nr:dihydrolipoyllysine-residue (2-methylpropanoyl)transferase [Chytriomyces confervae]
MLPIARLSVLVRSAVTRSARTSAAPLRVQQPGRLSSNQFMLTAESLRSGSRLFHSSAFVSDKVPFLLADIGEGITECEVIQWFVKEGDQIEQFSKICEVQSDKAAVEITSRYDGVVGKLHYKIGDMAKVGSPLVDIETGESSEPVVADVPSAASPVVENAAAAAPVSKLSGSKKLVPFLLADIGEGITECEVIQWFVKEGDRIEQFSKICEVQSDKAAVEITSRYDGVVSKLHYTLGDMAKVGSPLVDIEMEDESSEASAQEEIAAAPSATSTPASTTNAPVTSKKNENGEVLAMPSARRLAKETGVDLNLVSGTGKDYRVTKGDVVNFKPQSVVGAVRRAPANKGEILATPAVRSFAKERSVDLGLVSGTGKEGRITKDDILQFINASKAAPARPVEAESPKAEIKVAASSTPASSDDTVKPLTVIQKAMFKQMTKSLSIPHFGFADEVILNATSAYRNSINASLSKQPVHGVKKITFMPIFIKSLSLALNEFPILNAKLVGQESGDVSQVKLQYRSSHNIGVAMDTPQGLLVPNVKNVQNKSIIEIAQELDRLRESAKKGLSNADMSGGTITLSNIGTVGGSYMHPVIVTSELCIGAIGKTQRLPRFEMVRDASGAVSEQVVAKEIMPVSWNADHRVVDGATMAKFVQLWKSYLENPALISAMTK